MSYAEEIANKVRNVLKKQVIEKGYEVSAVLSDRRRGTASLSDMGNNDSVLSEKEINIIITKHDVTLFPMALGDNFEDFLDFIWLVNYDCELNGHSPDEGMYLSCLGSNYIISSVSPTYLGGRLILKECRGKKVR